MQWICQDSTTKENTTVCIRKPTAKASPSSSAAMPVKPRKAMHCRNYMRTGRIGERWPLGQTSASSLPKATTTISETIWHRSIAQPCACPTFILTYNGARDGIIFIAVWELVWTSGGWMWENRNKVSLRFVRCFSYAILFLRISNSDIKGRFLI